MASTPGQQSQLVGASETTRLLPSSSGPTEHHNLAHLAAWRFRSVCIFVWLGTLLGALDGTIVATLLSDIGSSFHASNQASWLGTAYLLSLCCFTPIYGRLSDLLGRRNAYLIGLSLFTFGTLLCAVAPSMRFLIVARCVAGMGGGGVQSLGSVIMTDLVSLRYRGLFQGYANIAFGLGGALGGPLGGLVADSLGWRPAFWLQLPMMIVCGTGIFYTLRGVQLPVKPPTPASTGTSTPPPSAVDPQSTGWRAKIRRIDYLGSLTLVVAIGTLLLGVSLKTSEARSDGTDYPWTHPQIIALLCTAMIFACLFVLVEGYYAPEPILPLRFLTRRTPLAVAFTSFTMVFNQFSLLYNVPLYFSAVRLQSSSVAGAHLLPYSVLIAVGSVAIGWVMKRTGAYWWCAVSGGLIMVISAVLMCLWDAHSPAWLSWVTVAPAGFGYAAVLTSSLVALMTEVTRQGKGETAVATSMSYMFRMTGQVLGVSLSGAIVQAILQHDLIQLIRGKHAKATIYTIRHSISAIRDLQPSDRRAAVQAYQHALHVVFVVNLIFAIVTVLGLMVIHEEEMPEQKPKQGDDVVEA